MRYIRRMHTRAKRHEIPRHIANGIAVDGKARHKFWWNDHVRGGRAWEIGEGLSCQQVELVRGRYLERVSWNHRTVEVAIKGAPSNTDFGRCSCNLEPLHELNGTVCITEDLVHIPRVRTRNGRTRQQSRCGDRENQRLFRNILACRTRQGRPDQAEDRENEEGGQSAEETRDEMY